MSLFSNKHVYFYSVKADKLLIPVFDVCRVTDFSQITNTFIADWKAFIDNINALCINNINDLCNHINSLGYSITDKPKSVIKCMTTNNVCVVYNFPDLYLATETQTIQFLSMSNITLNEIKLRNDRDILSNMQLNHDSIHCLNIDTKEKICPFITDLTREGILIAVLIWWGYHPNDSSVQNKALNIITELDRRNSKKLYYCDNFLRILVNQKNNKCVIHWCCVNMDKIIWDEDMLGDLETCYLDQAKSYVKTESMFVNECKKRGL